MTRKIKYSRKDLKSPDEFISTLSRTTTWVKENRTTVLVASAVVILAFGGVFGTLSYLRWQETKASRALWPLMDQASEVLRSPAGDSGEKLPQVEKSLAAAANRYPDTRAALFATYYLGSLAYRQQEFDRSAELFRSGIAETEKQDSIMDFLFREGLGQALEAKGNLDEARKAYGEAATVATGELRTRAWMGEARTLIRQGRNEEAAAVYRKILAENPDTPQKDFIQVELSHLG